MVEIIQNGKCFPYIYNDRAIAMVFFSVFLGFFNPHKLDFILFFLNQCFVCVLRWSVLCISAFCKHVKLRNKEESCSGFTFWTSGLQYHMVCIIPQWRSKLWWPYWVHLPELHCKILNSKKLSLLTINLQTLRSLLWRKNSHTQKKSLCKIDLL